MFEGLKKLLKDFYEEAFISNKPPETTRAEKSEYKVSTRSEKIATVEEKKIKKESVANKPVIEDKEEMAPKIVKESDYRKILDGIDNLEDLAAEYLECPQQFEHLFKQYFLAQLDKTNNLEELGNAYERAHPDGVGERIIKRYQEILPDFLKTQNLEEIEEFFEKCLDQSHSKEIIKKRYAELLDKVDSFNELEARMSESPEEFDDLFGPIFQKILGKTDDIEELEDIYNNSKYPHGMEDEILNRYQEILPDFLKTQDIEEIEEFFEDCLDQDRFEEIIKKRYAELLDMVDSFDELEERRSECPEEFDNLFQEPYQKLLYTVKSVEDLEEYFKNCPDGFEDFYMRPYQKLLEEIDSLDYLENLYKDCDDNFNELFPGQYQRLLKKENSLSDLGDRLESCPEGCDGLIIMRYGEVLETVNSIEGLNDRMDTASTLLHGLIYARYQKIIPLIMEKMPKNEIQAFCEDICDDCKCIAIAYRDKMLEKKDH